jgi:type VI secretion system secreted protein Hcp
MAFDAFLKIATVPGESTDDKHKDWIEILSFNWGVSQPRSGSASGGGAQTRERADFTDFSIVHALDMASPKLMAHCCGGDHIKEVSLELCKAGGDKQKYMVYKMSDVVVTGVRPGGSSQGGDNVPLEEVSFAYSKIELEYTKIDAKGKAAGTVPAGWDLSKNAKI